MTYRIVQWESGAALDRAAQLTAVYHAAFEPYGEDDGTAETFRERSLPSHAGRTDFRCVAAVEDDALLGFGYGYQGARGQYWTDRVAGLAPADVVDSWLGGHFEVVELAVLPPEQGRGIGTALHDALLTDLPHPVALLSTWQHDTPARRLYLRRGWQPLAELPDATLMGLRLPLAPL
ncbi:GNAT family N-acetyltransferase [Actinocatenispora rupis]|uniref:N-acetyltransferase domain-containing protein n=1 Tax=Actinocatenispora rupis TaxID=519421 RepID=A0A8J3NGM9_9ACTN|nr:GNAT family N-acetyltransferase [Actinocatenispora rupis]GID16145.1 hypothetical protein Aru02nite_70340 [Actinocatenispora rupis]